MITTRNRLALACLIAATAPTLAQPVAAQRMLSAEIVVRHDPELIRLTHHLVGSLLRSRAVREQLTAAIGAERATDIDLAIRTPQDEAEQPPGVYAGGLLVECGEGISTQLDDKILDVVTQALAQQLDERLHAMPKQRLLQQRQQALAEFDQANERAREVLAQHERTEERLRERERQEATNDQLLDLSAQLHSREAEMQALERQLTQLKSEEAALRVRAIEVDQMARGESARLHELREIIEREEKASGTEKEQARRMLANLEALERAVASAETNRAEHSDRMANVIAEQQALMQRMRETAVEVEAMRTRMETVQRQMEDAARARAAAGDGDDAAVLDHRIRLQERALDAAAARREALEARLRSLQPVTVELWR